MWGLREARSNFKLRHYRLCPNLEVIICGSAAGKESARRGHYYADPSNRFWKTLHTVGLTPTEINPQDDRQVLEYGIGLTDLVKDEAGRDQEIKGLSDGEYLAARLRDLLRKYAPLRFAFNGKGKGGVNHALGIKASAKLDWGLQPALTDFPDIQIWIMPDTSGLNGHFCSLRHVWAALAQDMGRCA
ncbi:MAG: mismatch-specific DNA-glycosylase [Rhodobacteraceae bacterium]|nr:mismatch-specific DNA-glycosylase [Paracoccaceae bacterium]